MRASAVAGIVFANVHDELLNELTSDRSMASVPFASRYRLIDFTLSNLVNAGISNIGLLTKGNYRSLMDHIGSGMHWDLDRKNGGLHILPPYNTGETRRYHGNIEALHHISDFIEKSNADYIVICDADTVANVNLTAAIEDLEKNGADLTVVCTNGIAPVNHNDTMLISLNDSGFISDISFADGTPKETLFSLGITIFRRDILVEQIARAYQNECTNLYRDVLAKSIGKLNMKGYVHEGYAAVMDGINSYKDCSFKLLDSETRGQLFCSQRPVYTKTRDDMPTRYGTHSVVNNSLIGDGCVIDGTVRNSILFRGVRVEKGAVVENCILMQGVQVGKNALLEQVISDKDAVIGSDMILKGKADESLLIHKNQIV